MRLSHIVLACALVAAPAVYAGTLTFGDMDCLGTGCYGAADPTAGATLQGLAPGVVTMATSSFGHGYPFSPDPSDFSGTDQIYVGSVQTGFHDGYSVAPQRINGPQVVTLDYSSLVPAGQSLVTLTLGIATDDFQNPVLGQPFTASINGVTDAALTTELNSLNESGPVVQFLTIGIDPASLTANDILTLSINEGGDGGDGWAVDFFTVGVTTEASTVPEPATLALMAGGLALAAIWRKKRA